MLFERRLRDGLVNGTISLAFRRWRRVQVLAGRQYRLGAGAGLVLVESVQAVDPAQIGDDDARAAGFASPAELQRYLRGPSDQSTYRIAFGPVSTDDPRERLRHDLAELESLDARLARIDGARATLQAIGAHPGLRAADLMLPLGWTQIVPFKAHVRRLKELGLTISLEVGYRLSPRGEAYLRARPDRREPGTDPLTATAPDRAAQSDPEPRRARTRGR